MSILKNRGSRKGKGPKPMHSKKEQKKFEGEEVKSDFLEAAGLKNQSTEDDITSILETQGKLGVPKKGYINQTSMSSAVKRWNSTTPLMQQDVSAPNDNPGEYSSDMMRTMKPEILKETTKAREQSVKDNEAKATKKKANLEKAEKIKNAIAYGMELMGGKTPTTVINTPKGESESESDSKDDAAKKLDEAGITVGTTTTDKGDKSVIRVG